MVGATKSFSISKEITICQPYFGSSSVLHSPLTIRLPLVGYCSVTVAVSVCYSTLIARLSTYFLFRKDQLSKDFTLSTQPCASARSFTVNSGPSLCDSDREAVDGKA